MKHRTKLVILSQIQRKCGGVKATKRGVTGEERGRKVKILLFGRRVCRRAFSFAFLFLFNSLKGYLIDDHFIGETPADNLAVASATDHESNR